jgi:hypothetical protein
MIFERVLLMSCFSAVAANSTMMVDIIDFSDMVVFDAFNNSYLAKNKFKELSPVFPGFARCFHWLHQGS